MQVINLKLESNMKEEMLEAIYGTVERLEQRLRITTTFLQVTTMV